MSKYEMWGNKLTTILGLENNTVIEYWEALEQDRFMACTLIYLTWLYSK